MGNRQQRERAPSRRDIARFWIDDGRMHGAMDYVHGESVSDISMRCWACGFQYEEEQGAPDRAHIIPHRAGGADNLESNYVLLCKLCHRA